MTEAIRSAIHCGRYDCGHITRSDDRAVKRALYLYLRREAGLTLTLRGEARDTLTALAMMREGRPCTEVRNYRVAGVTAASTPATPAQGVQGRITPQMVEVLTMAAQGYSIPEIADATYRSTETVRSLFARACRITSAHSTMAAAVTILEEVGQG